MHRTAPRYAPSLACIAIPYLNLPAPLTKAQQNILGSGTLQESTTESRHHLIIASSADKAYESCTTEAGYLQQRSTYFSQEPFLVPLVAATRHLARETACLSDSRFGRMRTVAAQPCANASQCQHVKSHSPCSRIPPPGLQRLLKVCVCCLQLLSDLRTRIRLLPSFWRRSTT